jgi:hypothetical protein
MISTVIGASNLIGLRTILRAYRQVKELHKDQVVKERPTGDRWQGLSGSWPTTGLTVGPGDHLAEHLPSGAVELLQLHLLDRLKIGRASR